MEYSPKLLASLTVQAFILGTVLGLLCSLLRFLRVLLGERGHSVPQGRPYFPRFLSYEPSNAFAERKLTRGMLFLLRFFEDVLFCVTAAVGIILLAYVGNNGRIRWFILFGTALGFTCYTLTLGKLFSYASELLARMVRLICRYIVFALLFPVKVAVKGIRILLSATFRKLQRRIRKARDARFHALQVKTLFLAASEGFDCVRCAGLETPTRPRTERSYESCKNDEDVKNKRRRRVYGRTAKCEKTSCKSPKAS